MRRGQFRWSVFAVALAVSLAWHGFYVIPNIIGQLIFKPEPQLEVAVIDPDDLNPQPDEPPAPPEKEPKSKTPKEKVVKTEAKKPPEVATVEPPKPEPKKPVIAQPVPVKPAPPPPPMPQLDHRKQMVDQDNFPDEADNAEARYLAQKNHRTQKETRAEATNLIRRVESPQENASEPNQNELPKPGGKTDKIAELENHEGPKNALPRSSPMHGNEGQSMSPEKPGPLSMRNLTPRAIEQRADQKAREGVELQERGAGDLPMARVGRDGERGQTGEKKKGGNNVKLTLDHHNYDNIEGFATAENERLKGARAEVSHKAGRWDKFQAKAQAMRSSIENFTFDVKPGNQAELGTRASPFAAYITAMHRQIHKLFTFGFLADLDARPSQNSPYNNEELWTQLEIVIKGDGTVDKVGIVRSSGVLPFDVAAIDSVMSAAPFPVPPQVIKSANGKVYLDWQFHRNELACGTFNVDPHILTTVGDNTEHDTSVTGAEGLARMKQQEGGRSLKRLGHEEAAHPVEEIPESRAVAPAPAETPQVTDEARNVAQSWFAAYQRGDAAWLAGWSAAPMTAAGEIVAKDGAAVKAMYKQLMSEAPQGRTLSGSVEVLTPAGIRGKLGGLPPGGEEKGMLYAVGKAGGEEFILLLKMSSQGWRVCGIDR